MRNLTEEELRLVFEKLSKFLGENTKSLLNNDLVFRLHNKKVLYMRKNLVRACSRFARDRLVSSGTILGKFTHSGKFHLTITSLDLLAQYCQNKVWLKQNNEMSFLYGNDVTKHGMKKMSQGVRRMQGVVVYSSTDIPMGFGIAAKSLEETRMSKPTDIVVINQADSGFFLREEDTTSIFV